MLAQSIFSGAVRAVSAGADPSAVQRGIKTASEIVLAEVRKHSRPVSGQLIVDVGSMAADGDREVGQLVAKAIQEAGANGLITVEESRATWTEVRAASSLRFERGYLSPYFISDPERSIAVLDDPYILLYEEKIGDLKTLLPFLEQIASTAKPLLIIAEDVEGEALASLVIQKLRGSLHTGAVKAPEFGDRRSAVLEDIAVFTGGTAITVETGSTLEQVPLLENCGRARKITISRDSTTIIDAGGRPESVEDRVKQLRAELEQTASDYDRQKLAERLARLSGKAVVIAVGAMTETELKEKSARMEDALQAAQSATEEGIVPGGGVALLRASDALENVELPGDEQIGVALLKLACEAPVRQIAGNAGFEGGFIASRLRSTGDWNFGFNVVTGEFQDLMQAGIVDSAKVTRSTLENASFVASQLLASEPILTELAGDASTPPAHTPARAPTPSHAKPPMAPPPAPPPPLAEAPRAPSRRSHQKDSPAMIRLNT